ncbi:MAG: hypothetical protein KDD61_03650 [Bdellovibrionales bacterium]|nr:hypothetical protein [Bdellovibrionales bacterium]
MILKALKKPLILIKLILLTATIVIEHPGAGSASAQGACPATVGNTQWRAVNRSLMMALRSNASFTRAWFKENVSKFFAREFVELEAYVIGDIHLNNLAPKLISIGGTSRKRSEMTVIDFDDAHFGKALADLFYLSVITRSGTQDISAREIAQSYLDGLNGKPLDTSQLDHQLQAALKLTPQEIERLNEKYTEGHISTKRNKVRLNHKKLDTKKISKSSKEVQDVFPILETSFKRVLAERGYQVIDWGYTSKEEGGSMGLHRFFALAQKEGQLKIFQFKELESIEGQSAYERVAHAMSIFWNLPFRKNNSTPLEDHHEVISTEVGTYLMAVKEKRLYRYENKATGSLFPTFQAGTHYIAQVAGQYLGQQSAGLQLKRILESKSDKQEQFLESVDAMVNAYIVPTTQIHNQAVAQLKRNREEVHKAQTKNKKKKKRKKKDK